MQPNPATPTATPTTATATETVPVEAIAGPATVLLIAVLTWAAFVIWLQTATGARLP